jgi:hypothetical protein
MGRPVGATLRPQSLVAGLLLLWHAALPGVELYGPGTDPRRRQPGMSDSPTLLRDLIDIPERVQTNDFVLKVPIDRLGQFPNGPGAAVAGQQQVQHRHQMAFAGAERAVQVAGRAAVAFRPLAGRQEVPDGAVSHDRRTRRGERHPQRLC